MLLLQRATAAEREVEKLKHQLTNLTASLSQSGPMQKAPDMEQAIDILQRSSMEVELAAKEKEVGPQLLTYCSVPAWRWNWQLRKKR